MYCSNIVIISYFIFPTNLAATTFCVILIIFLIFIVILNYLLIKGAKNVSIIVSCSFILNIIFFFLPIAQSQTHNSRFNCCTFHDSWRFNYIHYFWKCNLRDNWSADADFWNLLLYLSLFSLCEIPR
jgi:hypothetical protein